MALSQVSASGTWPIVWTGQVQKQIRQEGLDDDQAFVEAVIIPAVVDRGEIATRRTLVDSVWDLRLDGWPCEGFIDVPRPPLVSITSITYVDTNGEEQTWATDQYDVDIPVGPRCRRGRIEPAYGVSWPTIRRQMNAVTVRFRAGYVDQSGDNPAGPVRETPPLVVAALLMDAGTLYEHRESLLVDRSGLTALQLPGFSGQIYDSFRSYPRSR